MHIITRVRHSSSRGLQVYEAGVLWSMSGESQQSMSKTLTSRHRSKGYSQPKRSRSLRCSARSCLRASCQTYIRSAPHKNTGRPPKCSQRSCRLCLNNSSNNEPQNRESACHCRSSMIKSTQFLTGRRFRPSTVRPSFRRCKDRSGHSKTRQCPLRQRGPG